MNGKFGFQTLVDQLQLKRYVKHGKVSYNGLIVERRKECVDSNNPEGVVILFESDGRKFFRFDLTEVETSGSQPVSEAECRAMGEKIAKLVSYENVQPVLPEAIRKWIGTVEDRLVFLHSEIDKAETQLSQSALKKLSS